MRASSLVISDLVNDVYPATSSCPWPCTPVEVDEVRAVSMRAPAALIAELVDAVYPRNCDPIRQHTRSLAEVTYALTGSIAAAMTAADVTYSQAHQILRRMAAA
jgi:hypothetical protein